MKVSICILFNSFGREVIFNNHNATQLKNTTLLIILLGFFELG